MELDSEDKLLFASVLVLKRRIRRQLLTKHKKKCSVWIKEIFKNRGNVSKLPYLTSKI